MARYKWSALNRLQKGSFGEHFAKMEFSMYGLLVFSAEVDDRGIDFVARNERGQHFDVQVKTVTERNYTYIAESKFPECLWVCLVILEESTDPQLFLFAKQDWNSETEGLLKRKHYPNASEPEYGIHLAKVRNAVLDRFRFDAVILKLC